MPIFGGISGEFGERVKRLRLLRQWDQATLAHAAGTSATTVSQIERGRVSATAEQIAGIAGALGYSVEFLTSELNLVATTRPWLRAYADASKREADARTGAVAVAVEYIRRLDLPVLPDLVPHFSGDLEDDDAIEEAAVELRQHAQIELEAVVPNAMRVAERLGCVVLPLESELGRHVGMSVRSDHIPVMYVAKGNVPGDRQRLTVAHELGHLVLHGRAAPPGNTNEAARMERQAYRFAAAFLAPAEPLIDSLNEVGGKVTLRALVDLKAMWGVSVKSLVGRFQSLDVVDADHARSLYKQISARKWTKDEPVHVPTESAQWLERTLLRKAGTNDLEFAASQLASAIGGNSTDLFNFADWSPPQDADILPFSAAKRRDR